MRLSRSLLSPLYIAQHTSSLTHTLRHWLPGMVGALLVGALWIVLLYQVPAVHDVDIGGYDAAYVQGFHDPQYFTDSGGGRWYLEGSDGSIRWSRDRSYLLFPQAGLPGSVTLRLSGWRDQEGRGDPPRVQVWLNGETLLADVQTRQAWQEIEVPITGGLDKATDVVVEIRSSTTTLPNDAREVGVALDRAIYRVAPNSFIVPYPAQVLLGAGVVLLLWLVVRGLAPAETPLRRRLLLTGGAGLIVGLAFLLLYRLQPPFYPYPLRGLLPAVGILLAAVLALRYAPGLLTRRPALIDGLALVFIGGWLGGVLLAAQEHLTLSVPGVEKDFRVFATRTDSLGQVFQADGFYNLGYPLLLWLARPLADDNAFLAARLVAALSAALLLLASYWLARRVLADVPDYMRIGALLAVLLLACSPLVVQHALYVGSDMPFAALVALTLALLVTGTERTQPGWAGVVLLLLAGAAAGGAFLMRHLGLVLLAWGGLHCVLVAWRGRAAAGAWTGRAARLVLVFALGFGLLAAPQLVVNTLQTGQPLYNQQAGNIWLAVYGNTDWSRWHEMPDTVSLAGLVLLDPARFVANWWDNLVAFAGSGAEDTGEFGRALQLRLLSWPANWLAVIGLLGWLWMGWRRRDAAGLQPGAVARLSLPGLVLLYVAVVSLAFVLPRFFLPLVPIYAVAAAWAVGWLVRAIVRQNEHTVARLRWQMAAGLLLVLLLADGYQIGTRYVLERQPPDEVAVIRLTLDRLQPGERVLTRLPADVPVAKYSALAHRSLSWDELAAAHDEPALLTAAREHGAVYLLWDEATDTSALPTTAERVGGAGSYGLYRLQLMDEQTRR